MAFVVYIPWSRRPQAGTLFPVDFLIDEIDFLQNPISEIKSNLWVNVKSDNAWK